jgi:hypothetical protein
LHRGGVQFRPAQPQRRLCHQGRGGVLGRPPTCLLRPTRCSAFPMPGAYRPGRRVPATARTTALSGRRPASLRAPSPSFAPSAASAPFRAVARRPASPCRRPPVAGWTPSSSSRTMGASPGRPSRPTGCQRARYLLAWHARPPRSAGCRAMSRSIFATAGRSSGTPGGPQLCRVPMEGGPGRAQHFRKASSASTPSRAPTPLRALPWRPSRQQYPRLAHWRYTRHLRCWSIRHLVARGAVRISRARITAQPATNTQIGTRGRPSCDQGPVPVAYCGIMCPSKKLFCQGGKVQSDG